MISFFQVCICLVAAMCSRIACAQVEGMTQPPADWPKLSIYYDVVSDRDIAVKCRQIVAIAGCAMPRFSEDVCLIYLSQSYYRNFTVVSEEIAHCEGQDHHGESVLADAWMLYKYIKTARK